MAEVLHIFQVWIQKSHQLNYNRRVSFTHFKIFNGKQVFNHPLDMAAIFTHNQMITRSIVFHYVVFMPDKPTEKNQFTITLVRNCLLLVRFTARRKYIPLAGLADRSILATLVPESCICFLEIT